LYCCRVTGRAIWASLGTSPSYGQAGVAFWLLGFETKGRSIEEIDATLTQPAVLESAGAAGPAPRGVKDRRDGRRLDDNPRPGAPL